MEDRMPSQTIEGLRKTDVVVGKSSLSRSHPGNISFRKVVARNHARYNAPNAPNVSEKRKNELIYRIVADVRKSDGRFVEVPVGGRQAVALDLCNKKIQSKIRRKVIDAFRYANNYDSLKKTYPSDAMRLLRWQDFQGNAIYFTSLADVKAEAERQRPKQRSEPLAPNGPSLEILSLKDMHIIKEAEAESLVEALPKGNVCREVALSNNYLTAEALDVLIKGGLSGDQNIGMVSIENNSSMGHQGVKRVAEAYIKEKSSVRILMLWNNDLDDHDASELGCKLKEPNTIVDLLLTSNRIGHKGCQALASSIEKTKEQGNMLEFLTMDDNPNIGSQGASFLARMLITNNTLVVLHLYDTGIGKKGAIEICKATENNKTLRELNLGKNEIDDEGAQEMAQILPITPGGLEVLRLTHNKIGVEGIKALAELFKTKSESISFEDVFGPFILTLSGNLDLPQDVVHNISEQNESEKLRILFTSQEVAFGSALYIRDDQ